jgi:hypothetical protein
VIIYYMVQNLQRKFFIFVTEQQAGICRVKIINIAGGQKHEKMGGRGLGV